MERLTKHTEGGVVLIGNTTADMQATAGMALNRLAAYEDAMTLERAQELARAEKDGRLVVLPDGGDNATLAATVGKADISRVWCGGDNDLLVGLLSVLAGQVADKLGVKYGALLAAMMSKAPIKAPKEADEALAQENGRLRAENKRLHEENFWLTGHREGEPDGTAQI